ncbi:MAG: tetratricopeptide repeat protein [Bacteroidota bacterium]
MQTSSSKKLTKKEKQAVQQQQPSRKALVQLQEQVRKTRIWLGVIVAALGMTVYSNTIGHQFVLDDWGLIPENKSTRKGFEGIGEIFSTSYRTGMDVADNTLYRPLSKATFAVEWAIFPNNPMPGHLTNILLYGLTCFLLFILLNRLFKDRVLEAFLAAMLFAVHPIHTEVVANIKSRDEIMSLLFLFCAMLSALKFANTQKVTSLFKLAGYFFLAVMAKESALTWVAVIPLALYFFSDAPKARYGGVLIATAVPSLIFLLIRAKILTGEAGPAAVVDNYLNGIPDFLTQRTSAIALMGVYLFKLFVPLQLFSDGSYNHFPPYPITDWHFLLSAAVFSGLLVYAIKRFNTKDPIAFSILYFFLTISIVSNVVVLIGTNYAERLLFAPSVGWSIAVAWMIGKILRSDTTEPSSLGSFFSQNQKSILLTGLMAVGFSLIGFSRNNDWYDNETLYRADIKKVPESAHMRFYLANHITSEEYLSERTETQKDALRKEAISQLDTSIIIFPRYADAYQRRAFIYFDIAKQEAGKIDSLRNMQLDSLSKSMLNASSGRADSMRYFAVANGINIRFDSLRTRAFTSKSEPDYKKALEYNPSQSVAYNNYGNLLFETRRFAEAKVQFEQAVRYNPRYAHALNNLASIHGVFGDAERQAGNLVAAKQNYEIALSYFRKSIEQDREYYMPYYLMGITYRNMGDENMAQQYIRKSEEVKKTKRYNAYN